MVQEEPLSHTLRLAFSASPGAPALGVLLSARSGPRPSPSLGCSQRSGDLTLPSLLLLLLPLKRPLPRLNWE